MRVVEGILLIFAQGAFLITRRGVGLGVILYLGDLIARVSRAYPGDIRIGLIISSGIIIGPIIGAIIVLFIWTRAGSRRTSRR